MKKILNILFFIILGFNFFSIIAMDEIEKKLEEQEESSTLSSLLRGMKEQSELNQIQNRINNARSESERVALINQETKIKESQAKEKKQLLKNGEYYWQEKAEVTKGKAKIEVEKFTQAGELERVKAKAQIESDNYRQALVEQTKQKIDFIKNNPRLILGLAAGASLAFFAAKNGTALFTDYIRHLYRNPTLAQETSLISWYQKMFYGVPNLSHDLSDVVLEDNLTRRVSNIAKSVKNIVKNNAYFRNILFYGPPGTGKTMLAKIIARYSDLEYIYFAASSLDQYSLEEALIKLTELFEFAKKCPKKLMLIIDEAEMLFADRAKELSEKSRKMLNHILTYTGTESENFMIIALTNRPEDLDAAFLSRCGEKIEIPAPNIEQRKLILKKYINQYLIKNSETVKIKRSLFNRLFYAPTSPNKIKIEGNFILSNEFIDLVAQKLVDFTGRDISQLVLAFQAEAYATHDCKLTKQMVNEVIDIKIEEKKRTFDKFGKSSKKS